MGSDSKYYIYNLVSGLMMIMGEIRKIGATHLFISFYENQTFSLSTAFHTCIPLNMRVRLTSKYI